MPALLAFARTINTPPSLKSDVIGSVAVMVLPSPEASPKGNVILPATTTALIVLTKSCMPLALSIRLRIFAGLCLWRLPTAEEKQITCGKLEKGEVCYGELVETELPTVEKNLVLSSVTLTESDIETLKNALK